jgi:antitoxin ParD1/3/4
MKEAIRQFLDQEEAAEQMRLDTQRLAQYEADGKTISYDVVDAWLASWGTENEGQCPVDLAGLRDPLPDLRLEELRREIQKGIDSGPAIPLNIEEIKTRSRKKFAAQQAQG